MPARQARVLVAVSPEVKGRLASVLQGLDVTWARDTRDATRDRYELIVLGSHFAESTALESLDAIRAANPGGELLISRAA